MATKSCTESARAKKTPLLKRTPRYGLKLRNVVDVQHDVNTACLERTSPEGSEIQLRGTLNPKT